MEKEKALLFDLIPPQVIELIENGKGRLVITKELNISEPLARHFCWLYSYIENVDISNPTLENISNDGAKVLVLDIETAPMEVYAWHCRQKYINPSQIISGWFVISWAAKWLYSEDMQGDVLDDYEIKGKNDIRLIEQLHELLDEADIVIAHHGQYFDLPMIQQRFLSHNLLPVSPYRIIDTCKESKKIFRMESYKLDEIAKRLDLGSKIKTDFSLWSDCMQGDLTALNNMFTYNKQDVTLLEQVYIKLRPHIKNHPNMGLYIDNDNSLCPNCGSVELIQRGEYSTNISKYYTYHCKDCGAIARERKTNIDKVKRDNLLISIVR